MCEPLEPRTAESDAISRKYSYKLYRFEWNKLTTLLQVRSNVGSETEIYKKKMNFKIRQLLLPSQKIEQRFAPLYVALWENNLLAPFVRCWWNTFLLGQVD
jgi:hypothetical protein